MARRLNSHGLIVDRFSGWSDSIAGIRFRVLCKKDDLYQVELDNGDVVNANSRQIKGKRVFPKFLISSQRKDCTCKYDDFYIRQLYFDYKEECYVLATIDGELLKVSREGVLIDRIQE